MFTFCSQLFLILKWWIFVNNKINKKLNTMFINHKVDLKRNITFLKIYRSLNFTLISVNNEFSSWLVRINVVMHAYMQSVSSFVYIIVYIASIGRTCLSWTFHLNYSKYIILYSFLLTTNNQILLKIWS